jgi:hypothetical protein
MNILANDAVPTIGEVDTHQFETLSVLGCCAKWRTQATGQKPWLGLTTFGGALANQRRERGARLRYVPFFLGPAHQNLPRAKIRSGEIYREPSRFATSSSIQQVSADNDKVSLFFACAEASPSRRLHYSFRLGY